MHNHYGIIWLIIILIILFTIIGATETTGGVTISVAQNFE